MKNLQSFIDLNLTLGGYVSLNNPDSTLFSHQVDKMNKDVSKYLFSQFTLLFTSRKFNNMFSNSDTNDSEVKQYIKTLVNNANKALINMPYEYEVELESDTEGSMIMSNLY
jgi:hypothetical protein